ncbi:MAG: chromosome segregation protein SMC [Sporolactobacillus sp.]
MYLKRLDLSGFKSFAKKTVIEFVPGVTAVVGPNGSGKSNITEAIRWSLGEQSAKSLRGNRMEDIIFSGSDARKAVNLAEVTLLLDNSDHYLPIDYSELSVTRRVLRDGESSYLLNGQDCRLKDIIDLFMDSGLGKEAYSVIGQGKIDEILNSKAEEKRKIFEEAAGVLKYKLRKQSAEKQLNDSRDDLNRVEDILHELRVRIDPLREQSSIAKAYLEKKEELRQTDIALLVYDVEHVHADWVHAKRQTAELEQRRSELTASEQSKSAACREHRQTLEALEHQIDALQHQIASAGENMEKINGQKEVFAERRRHEASSSADMRERLDKLAEQLSEAKKLYQTEAREYGAEHDKLAALVSERQEKERLLGRLDENLHVQTEELNGRYIEVLNEQAALRNEQRYLNNQQDTLSGRTTRAVSNVDQLRAAADRARMNKQHMTEEMQHACDGLQRLRETLSVQQKELAQEKNRYEHERAAIGEIDRLIDQATARKDMLETLQEDYAGFYQGVRAILKERDRLGGICGAVAELVRVDPRYRLAIETALGAAQQHLVVTTEAAARHAIAFLRQSRSGRATFLPLSVVRGRAISQMDQRLINDQKAYLGTAAQLVTCETRYQAAVAHLLGHVVVADTLNGAGELAKATGYRYRIVTLEGDVISPGGAMTGGSVKSGQAGVLGRTSAIDELQQQLAEMRAKSQTLKAQFSIRKQSIAAAEMAVAKTGQALSGAESHVRQLEQMRNEAAAEEKSSVEKYQLIARENNEFLNERTAISERLAVVEQTLLKCQASERHLKDELEQLAEKQKNKADTQRSLQEAVTVLKVNEAKQAENVSHRSERLEDLRIRSEELDTAYEALSQSLAEMSGQLGTHAQTLASLADAAVVAAERKQQLKIDLETAMRARGKAQQALSTAEDELAALRQALAAVAGACERESATLNRLDVQLDHLLGTLGDDYELTLEAAKEHYKLDGDPEAARRQVKLIKRAIDELGTVNLGAIEEYETVCEREHFLSEQRADLLRARATLEHVMSEMDREVAERFSKTFDCIRQHFRHVFTALFGGGRADLRLVDPADLLGSGVDIFAEPPGKKLQRLSLLSGGERALTAIALLFAILKVRPVPFCVLDEVEAALDDANVDRYADYLKAFSADTQFIVVTHRHGTMERANVLYGVTMQESGVSRLVSVRLEETEHLLASGDGA